MKPTFEVTVEISWREFAGNVLHLDLEAKIRNGLKDMIGNPIDLQKTRAQINSVVTIVMAELENKAITDDFTRIGMQTMEDMYRREEEAERRASRPDPDLGFPSGYF